MGYVNLDSPALDDGTIITETQLREIVSLQRKRTSSVKTDDYLINFTGQTNNEDNIEFILGSGTTDNKTFTFYDLLYNQDGQIFYFRNESDYTLSIMPCSGVSIYSSGTAHGIFNTQRGYVALRYDHTLLRLTPVEWTGKWYVEGLKLWLKCDSIEIDNMDEAASGAKANMIDSSSRHLVDLNTGGAIALSSGVRSLSVNGTDEYLSIDDSTDWDIFGDKTGTKTLYLKAYFDDAIGTQKESIVSQRVAGTEYGFDLYRQLSDGKLCFKLQTTGTNIYLFGGYTDVGYTDKIESATVASPESWSDTTNDLYSDLAHSQIYWDNTDIYLFGGNSSTGYTNKIYTAAVASPESWSDTGNTLPGNLANSQIYWDDTDIYLFGGYTGSAATDAIYTASVSDPETWSLVSGKTLPGVLHRSQLYSNGKYIYLFGGRNGGGNTDVIYRASVSDPETWVDTTNTLVDDLAFSQVYSNGEYIYLFGGSIITHTDKIYRASVSDPETWSLVSGKTLPGSLWGSQLYSDVANIYLFGGYNGLYVDVIYRASVNDPETWVDTTNTLVDNLAFSQVYVDNISDTIIGTALSQSTWYDITLVNDEGDIGVYIDNTQVGFLASADWTAESFSGELMASSNIKQWFTDCKINNAFIANQNIFNASPNVGLTDTLTIPDDIKLTLGK